ncbi:MAG TPA: YciI family protein [Bacteroidia bacterium]|jgi:hypothetical protein|nr:YciI family protein [Bacteroidia bacterium]
MKEFMLLIRNESNSKSGFNTEKEESFLNSCKTYIEKLRVEGRLISAQPLIREGAMLSNTNGIWKENTFSEGEEVIVGYYHILAKDLKEAIETAKGNPEFEYTSTARVEIRPVKMKESGTGFIYPNK